MAVRFHVCMSQRVFVAEREERAQAQFGFRMRIHQRVADHQLRAFVDPQHLLAEDDAAHAVGDGGGRRIREVGDILVTARFVSPLEPVQGQVERLVMLHDGFVERREQDIRPVAVVDRSDHQPVVFARIAADDGRTHIPAHSVGGEHFALKRILQIAQLVFVECKR